MVTTHTYMVVEQNILHPIPVTVMLNKRHRKLTTCYSFAM